MITTLIDLPVGVVGLRIGGCLTAKDYDDVITPTVEAALRGGRRLRCLVEIDPDFTGLTPPAAVDDVRLGLHAFGSVDGIAIVTGIGWLVTATEWAGLLMPFPLRVFDPAERGAAEDWLTALRAGAPRRPE